jgi:Rad3-related DNA helicase
MKISKFVQTEQEKPQIVISVRNLVEFLWKAGDIDEGKGSRMTMEAMQQGSRIHRKLQKRAGLDYHAEVPLKHVVSYEAYDFGLEGRADGLIYDDAALDEQDATPGQQDITVTVDEIKGMYRDVMKMEGPVPVHLAQAKCYAYIFALQHHLTQIRVQMTYCNLDTEEIWQWHESYDFDELAQWFVRVLADYRRWSDFLYEQKMRRQASIQGLTFPYEYRPGQKQLVGDVYRSLARRKLLFMQAPTGTGKTLSTVYPAVQALGQDLGDKIFYLTAKTATGLVARDAFLLLEQQGYQGKTVVITARDKMCLLEERACNPRDCAYAKGHFDRVNDAVYELLQQQNMLDRETICAFARQKKVCPFEFCLDLSSWADHLICDYNYVFDPNVCLKRFFAEGQTGDYLYLVDEAHNLVDRAREMYSESLVKEDFLQVKKWLKPFGKKLENALNRCNRCLLAWKRTCENMEMLEDMDEFLFALYRLATAMDELLEKDVVIPERNQVLEFYFRIRNFLNLAEGMDEHYRIYCDYREDGAFVLHLFCVDPSFLLQQRLDRAKGAVFFSATLLPVNYYKKLLCCEKDVYAIYADSVFASSQRAILIGTDVSTRYTRRTLQEYERYADYISRIIGKKQGNYMVFGPSYRVLEEIYAQFLLKDHENVEVILQTNGMGEAAREAFLETFARQRSNTLVAFCVLGGVFSEGIDLTGEKLIGAIIAGVGLPQVGNRREIMKDYFGQMGQDGFAFAYLYPGMNKVIQAAGRVIRTAEDRGVIALLDDRFCQKSYQEAFPREWSDYQVCSLNRMDQVLEKFWGT